MDLLTVLNDAMTKTAINQRADIARFSGQMRNQLRGVGMTFDQPHREALREALSRSGFYARWKKQFGDEVRSLLEASTRKLA